MEKKPNKKIYKNNHPVLIIDSSEHSTSDYNDSNYQTESPKKPTKNKNAIKSITDINYDGDTNKTFTKSLSKDEIKLMLEGYKKVSPFELKKGHNIRYFIKDTKTGEMLFRTGGMITHIVLDEDKQYIVVSGGKTFSVQLKPTTIFFQQQPLSEIIRDVKEKFEIDIDKLNMKIKTLEKENSILLKHNKMMNKEIEKLNNQLYKKPQPKKGSKKN